ncbi:HIRAN domain-containing protein [Shouchella clausii]|uniref:HIRAN domain-containing protein n=1 Tax=Shouchella clausii TaxID=79880 RepID=UPI0039829294
MEKVLWLIWQNTDTRNKYHVGNLYCDSNGYRFEYNLEKKSRNLEAAMDDGFLPLTNFPDVNRVYQSKTLFPAFSKRLPNKRRPDYQQLLQKFGVDHEVSDMELLQVTKGKTDMDSMELFQPIVVDENGRFQLAFFIEGWRYYQGDDVFKELQIDDKVLLILEPENSFDRFAVYIETEDGVKLGYVPAVYSEFIFKHYQHLKQPKIVKKHDTAIPEMKVQVQVEGTVSRNREKYVNMDPVRESSLLS